MNNNKMQKKKYEFYPMSTFRFELKVIAKLERQTGKKTRCIVYEHMFLMV